jgi:hypothetical protein
LLYHRTQVVGAIAFGIGVWGVVEGTDYDAITGDETVSAAALLLVGGIVTFAVASVGIVGACGMCRPLLFIYALAVAVIIILEFVAAILAFVFVDEITDQIRENMEEAIMDYRFNSSAADFDEDNNDVVDRVQNTFDCCGIDNATDWRTFNLIFFNANGGQPPASCSCTSPGTGGCMRFEDSYNAWSVGCLEELEDNLEPVGIAVGVLAIIFAIIEVLLILMALGLCCRVYMAKRQSVV